MSHVHRLSKPSEIMCKLILGYTHRISFALLVSRSRLGSDADAKGVEMSFLLRLAGLSLRDGPRSSFQAGPSRRRPPGQTKHMPEKLYFSAGLGRCWFPPGGVCGRGQGEEHLDLFA